MGYTKRSDSKDWARKNWYAKKDNSRGIVGQ